MRLITDDEIKKFCSITNETLCDIMDMETEKPEEETDVDLVYLCSDIINMRSSGKLPEIRQQTKKVNTKKVVRNIIIIVAAISLFLAALSVAHADIFIDLGNAVVNMFKDDQGNVGATVDTTNSDTTPDGYALADTDLAKQLAVYGVEPATLPDVLTNGDYDISDIEEMITNDEPFISNSKTIKISFSKGKVKGYAFITKSLVPDNRETKKSNFYGIENTELVNANGLDVFLFKQRKNYYIRYEDSVSQINYNISLSKCDYEEAKKIAESIK